jgi:methylase of polypeptide subunit release factors
MKMSLTSSLILLLLWLLSLASLLLLVSKILKPALLLLAQTSDTNLKLEKERNKALTQALNLLASKEPIAYQMLQAATPQTEEFGVYNGPYVPGEEFEELLNAEKRMDAAWKVAQQDLED